MKRKHTNEIALLKYYRYLREADGKAESTVLRKEKSVHRFQLFTRFEDFRDFRSETAMRFKVDLSTGDLQLASQISILQDVRQFFLWLSQQPGYRKSINPTDADYFRPTDKQARSTRSPEPKPFPNLDVVIEAVLAMPASSLEEQRDRALVAFIALTGIRDGAVVGLKLKHFDQTRMLVTQNPLDMNTKFSKRIDTFLFPLDTQLESIVLQWHETLRDNMGLGENNPVFPATLIVKDGENCFANGGLSNEHWKTAAPVRQVFRKAFRAIDQRAYGPHSLRRMIISEMYRRELTVAKCKAWSQNLGHEGAMTTLTSYGRIGLEEQGRLVRNATANSESDLLAQIREIVERRNKGKK